MKNKIIEHQYRKNNAGQFHAQTQFITGVLKILLVFIAMVVAPAAEPDNERQRPLVEFEHPI